MGAVDKIMWFKCAQGVKIHMTHNRAIAFTGFLGLYMHAVAGAANSLTVAVELLCHYCDHKQCTLTVGKSCREKNLVFFCGTLCRTLC
jgi:hypothetical protein